MTGFVQTLFTDPKMFAVFLGALMLAWYFFSGKRYNLPPGPYNWPLIGSTIAMMRSKHGKRAYMQFMDWGQKYGGIIRVNLKMLFLGDLIVINEIDEAMEALVMKSSETGGRMQIYSFGIFTDGGKDIAVRDYDEQLKYMRRVSGAALRNLLAGGKLEPMAHASIEKGIEEFRKKAETQEAFDPSQMLTLQVYNIICAMCFNVNYDLQDEEFQLLYRLEVELNQAFDEGFLVDFFPPARYLPPTKAWKKLLEGIDVINNYLYKHIKEHKETYNPDNLRDIIDYMIKQEELESQGKTAITLDDVYYKNILSDLFHAGVETTSMTLLFITFLLTEFPEVQDKVQEEIDRVVGRSRLPCIEDKPKMPYCEAVMYECMRFGTIVPLGLPHKAMCDTKIGGYDIPKGTTLIINHHALHRDPKEWKNPDAFDPSHFLGEDGELLPKPRSFLPFGAGKRVCLGETIAKPEIFMIFTAMFQRFRFRFEEGHKRDLSFTNTFFSLYPQPFKVIAEERQ